jgi:hypothetical protein
MGAARPAAAGRAPGRKPRLELAKGAALLAAGAALPAAGLAIDVTLVGGDVLRWTGGADNSRGAVVRPTAGFVASLLGTALTWRASGSGDGAGALAGLAAAAPTTAGAVLAGAAGTLGLVEVAEVVRAGAGRGPAAERWAVGTGARAGPAAAGAGVAGIAGPASNAGAGSSGQVCAVLGDVAVRRCSHRRRPGTPLARTG